MSESPTAAAAPAPVPDPDRLEAVRRTGLLDTAPEEVFDRQVRVAARALRAPAAFLARVDEGHAGSGRCHAYGGAPVEGRPLEGSALCGLALPGEEPLVIPDAGAAADHPAARTLASLGVAAYLGVPLVTAEGRAVGSFCVVDLQPRQWTPEEVEVLGELARAALREIELREALGEVERRRSRASNLLESITDAFFALDEAWRFTYVNEAAERLLRREREELRGRSIWEAFPEAVGSTFEREYRRAVDEGVTVEFEEFYPPLDAWFEVHAYPSEEGLSVFFQDVTRFREAEVALRESEARQRFLGEASALLATSLDYATTLQRVADLAVPELADWCAVYLVDEETGPILPVAIAHRDPERVQFGWELLARYPSRRDAPSGAARTIRTGESELVAEVPTALLEQTAHDEEHLRLLRALELRSFMAAPLSAHGRTLGAVAFYSSDPERRYTEADLRMAEELARRAAVSLENAELVEAQRREEERYRSLVQATAAIVWTTPASGEFESEQPEWARFTGQRREEYLGTGWSDALHPEDREPTFARWAQALEQSSRFEMEHRLRRRDGEYREMLVRAVPIVGEGGAVREWVGLHTDVTERRRAERALRESEERYRILSDLVPQHIWITDREGYHEYYNERWYEYTGLTQEAAAGEGWSEVLHPDDVEHARSRWEHSLRTGEPYSVEYRFRRHDGAYRWFLGQALPRRDEQGRIVRWYGTLTEIQDQKEAEVERERLIRALEKERARLQRIFAQAPAAIAVTQGPEHVTVSTNRMYRELTGGREVEGVPVRQAFPELAGQGLFELLDGVYASGEPYVGRETAVQLDRDGDGALEEAFFNFVYQPLTDAEERVTGIMTFAVEVTDQVRARRVVEANAAELRQLAHRLEASNQELDQFAYVASHDLKAPLRGIANLSNWIEEDLEGEVSDEVREHLELLRGRVNRMEGLIDGILEYSRAGRVREKPERVEVPALLDEVVDLLAPPEGFEVRFGDGMPTLIAERLPLQQVFLNLVGNAVKYNARPGGWVEVGARDEGPLVHFTVADNGPGIAPEYHDRIFGIFQTLQARDKVEGTGIGLSLVKKMVENRGGRVWLESEEGAGAAFHFLWPRETREDS